MWGPECDDAANYHPFWKHSVSYKFDELDARAKYFHECREANVICLPETWLKENDDDPESPGFTVLRFDRSAESGKTRGGGPFKTK